MDRPISKRGKNDAQIMSELIDTINLVFHKLFIQAHLKEQLKLMNVLKYSSVFKKYRVSKV